MVVARALWMTAVGSMNVAVDGLATASVTGWLAGTDGCGVGRVPTSTATRRRSAGADASMAKRVVLNSSRRSRDSTHGRRRLTPFCRFVIGKPSHGRYRREWGGGFELKLVEHITHFDRMSPTRIPGCHR